MELFNDYLIEESLSNFFEETKKLKQDKITLPNDIIWNSQIEHLYGERIINLKLSDLNHLYNIDTFEIAKQIGEDKQIIEFNNLKFKKIEGIDYFK